MSGGLGFGPAGIAFEFLTLGDGQLRGASRGTLEGRRVFSEDVIASMHETHATQDREFGPFRRFGWGYGWDLGSWEGRTIVHRFGSFTGYRSHMSFEPATGIGVVVRVALVREPTLK